MSGYDRPDQNDTGPTTRVPPPLAEGKIIDMILKIKSRGKRIPDMFPTNPKEAALYWISHQEPETEMDRPEWIYNTKSEAGGAWQTPYVDRVVSNLKIFLKLKSPDQHFIIEHIAGYPWRGDSIDFYIEVIKNTDQMRKDVAEHGRAPDGKLPVEYTRKVMQKVMRASKQMANSLPYDKDERLET